MSSFFFCDLLDRKPPAGNKIFFEIRALYFHTINGQFSLNYERTFADNHNISASTLYEITDYSGDNIMASGSGFLSTAVDYLFGGSTQGQLNNGSAFEMERASYAGRLNYTFKSKYLPESTLRYDASAKFPSDSRWGLFPSISLGRRLSEENFMKNSMPSLDYLKLRASYSESGYDAIGNFQYLAGYQYGQVYALGSGPQQALYDKGLPNPLLTWETMTTYNLGLDMSLRKRKLYGEFDVFYRKREGIMGNRMASLPSTFGASLPPENINSADEDEGQMSAWFVMSALGLFQMDGSASTEPIFEIGSPLFEKAVIHPDRKYYPGGTFNIEARNNSKENRYIQSAVLNGKPLNKPWFYHSELVAGGSLDLQMGPKPNK